MDKQSVPLLTAEDAQVLLQELPGGEVPKDWRTRKLSAIASRDAATYNTHTHEVVPKGMRGAVAGVAVNMQSIAEVSTKIDAYVLADFADDLQRALNGEKA